MKNGMRKGGTCIVVLAVLLSFPMILGSNLWAAQSRGIGILAVDKASGEKKEVRLYGKSYAVIIGIDQYKNLGFDMQLSYAVRDAKGVEDVLKKNSGKTGASQMMTFPSNTLRTKGNYLFDKNRIWCYT